MAETVLFVWAAFIVCDVLGNVGTHPVFVLDDLVIRFCVRTHINYS